MSTGAVLVLTGGGVLSALLAGGFPLLPESRRDQLCLT